MERTLVLIKPDAVGRGLNFKITEKFEKKSFKLAACRIMIQLVQLHHQLGERLGQLAHGELHRLLFALRGEARARC